MIGRAQLTSNEEKKKKSFRIGQAAADLTRRKRRLPLDGFPGITNGELPESRCLSLASFPFGSNAECI
jgi:hypothetical protein